MILFHDVSAIVWRSLQPWQNYRRMNGIPWSPGLRKGESSEGSWLPKALPC